MNRSDFQALAELRSSEAQALLSSSPPFPDGAYYLAGYAVECALKACIAKLTNQYDFPDKIFVRDAYSHGLESLVRLAGLVPDLDATANADKDFARAWAIAKDWKAESRYRRIPMIEAEKFIDAVTHQKHGVLQWIQARW